MSTLKITHQVKQLITFLPHAIYPQTRFHTTNRLLPYHLLCIILLLCIHRPPHDNYFLDAIDGVAARHFDQCSKLRMDHFWKSLNMFVQNAWYVWFLSSLLVKMINDHFGYIVGYFSHFCDKEYGWWAQSIMFPSHFFISIIIGANQDKI